jgi:hypothetical protein
MKQKIKLIRQFLIVLLLFLGTQTTYCQNIEVFPTVINFGNIEIGLRASALVKIVNVGAATVTVDNASTTSTFGTQWDQVQCYQCAFPLSLVRGEAAYLKITFMPDGSTGVGVDVTASLSLSGTGTTPTVTPQFSGQVVAQKTVNVIAVVDRSLSMKLDLYTGKTRIDAVEDGLNALLAILQSALRLPPLDPAHPAKDYFGVVKFNDSASDLLTYASVTGTTVFPTDMSSQLRPERGTAIGGALKTAFQKLPYSVPAPNIAILFSDGVEGRRYSSKAVDVIGEMRDDSCTPGAGNCLYGRNVKVYSIGFGLDSNAELLRNISLASGVQDGVGFYQIENEPSNNSTQGFLFKIIANAKGYSTVRDPIIQVNLSENKPIEIQSINLTSSDIAASIFIADDSTYRKYYTLELKNPNGQVFRPNEKERESGSISVAKNTFVFGIIKQKGKENNFAGTWKLFAVPNGNCDSIKSTKENAGRCIMPLTFAASVKSNLKLEASVFSSRNEPGAEITLMAQATEEGLPIDIQSITVDVKAPGSRQIIPVKLSLISQNEKGKPANPTYTAKFFNTANEGTYQFTFNAIVKNNKGEVTTREELRFLPLTYSFSNQASGGVMEDGTVLSQPWTSMPVGTIFISLLFGGVIVATWKKFFNKSGAQTGSESAQV